MLHRKKSRKYEFILKGGNSLLAALYKLFQVVWDREVKPDMWCNTVLIQLYKGKGPKSNLDNLRNIHTKMDIPKFFGNIVTNAVKPIILENMSPFQLGMVPGHRCLEILFIIKSVKGLFEDQKKAIALQLWDFSKFFDWESLVDGLNERYKANVNG